MHAAPGGPARRGRRRGRRRPPGPTGCSWNSNEVTTPKLPPPPRKAQNSSGSDVRRRRAHRAVGRDDASRSAGCRCVRPCRRVSQPKPPPSVRPATPVVELMPSGVGQAMRLRFAIDIGQQRAGADTRRALRGVDGDRAHARQVDHQAAVGHCVAGDVMAATAHAQQHAMRRPRSARRPAHRSPSGSGRSARDGDRWCRSRPCARRRSRRRPCESAAADLRGEGFDVRLARSWPDVVVERKVRSVIACDAPEWTS